MNQFILSSLGKFFEKPDSWKEILDWIRVKLNTNYIPNDDYNYDFFISYANDDNKKGSITKFVEQLKKNHDFKGGSKNPILLPLRFSGGNF